MIWINVMMGDFLSVSFSRMSKIAAAYDKLKSLCDSLI